MTTCSRWMRQLAQAVVPPLVVFGVVIAIWQACMVGFAIKPYLLPAPLSVAKAFLNDAPLLARAVMYTGSAAAIGFAGSLIVGTLIAFAFSQSPTLRACGYPYFIFLQTVPIVAIAPLIVRWCGYGFQSVVFVSFILGLFPILSNGTQGLLDIDPDLLDLFRLNNASRWQVLMKLRFPSAVPGILAGARTASGLSVVGSIVGEFFVGYGSKQFGLGYLIYSTNGQSQLDRLFAAVLTSTLFGIAIFGFVNLVSVTILRGWYDGPVEHRS
ncbi:ABC transporter permease [Schlesneria paludicola]|uniref:ABC transporter permease n=1 Tax=Schlesneria paludicola TaxID=360056 RepID=UPI0012FCE66D|nr:ABC transporter permease [Schlesneria paludicola]